VKELGSLPGRAGNAVVVNRDATNGRRHSEVDHGERAIQLTGGMSARDQILESDQTTLETKFDQGALFSEVARWSGECGIEFVLSPGGMHIHNIGDRQCRNAGSPELGGRNRTVEKGELLGAQSTGAESENQ